MGFSGLARSCIDATGWIWIRLDGELSTVLYGEHGQVQRQYARLQAGGDACQIGNPLCISHLIPFGTTELLVAKALRNDRFFVLS